jgi:hypothetical protein
LVLQDRTSLEALLIDDGCTYGCSNKAQEQQWLPSALWAAAAAAAPLLDKLGS